MFLQILEIFTLVTGVVYVLLQIWQSNWMWPVDILCCAAAVVMFASQRLWANLGLNVYYILMAFWGIYAWRRDSKKVDKGEIHLSTPTKAVYIASIVIALVGGVALIEALRLLGDPAPVMDGIIGILGAVGCWWLANSYIDNWMIWIVADSLTAVLCLTRGLYWMAAMYLLYVGAAVNGYLNWKKHGKYV